MAQYQILARKSLGPSGTGPKTLGVKNSVATQPRDHRKVSARRRTAACTECGTLPHAAGATARNGCARGRTPARTPRAGGRQVPRATLRDNHARWPAIGTVAARSYSARRARTLHATVRIARTNAHRIAYSRLGATCLDWSRREDIQARTVKGRLSWTGRRYLAGTVRGRPNWFGSLLPEVQGTSSWFISWMLEQHEDQAQKMKSSSSAESRVELKCRVEAQNAQVQNSSSADQVQCTRAVIECEAVYKSSDQVHA
ncbi:polyadenylate-binding protein 1 [Dorcoceras hygrometricum]|uniref:Polyadenylate-binding protein 1 n=1 Tax=Dorcoceras hygrometricum TaxID=472368 RepID=A0A2Z7C692_9LAMI|nr:polyadenylate-binding protein 1 [Dorcoceras hygrometricum]